MLDMRDNMITADALRFDGANADLLWNAFAARGMGAGASSGPSDTDPVPSFASPYSENVEVTFKALGEASGKPVRLYVGDYDYGSVPVADTDPATALPTTVTLAPGTYRFLAIGAGYGHKRFTQTIYPGVTANVGVVMPANLASAASGATITGDGTNLGRLTDDAEGTAWTATGGAASRQVTVDLPTDAPKLVSRVQLSAFPGAGAATSAMYSTVRQFEILTCNATTGADCATDAGYKVAYASAANAFDTAQFRPQGAEPAPEVVPGPPDPGHARAAAGAHQPVHGQPALRGRAGERPAQHHRLRDGLGRGGQRGRRRVRGVQQLTHRAQGKGTCRSPGPLATARRRRRHGHPHCRATSGAGIRPRHMGAGPPLPVPVRTPAGAPRRGGNPAGERARTTRTPKDRRPQGGRPTRSRIPRRRPVRHRRLRPAPRRTTA
nr:hypothetical protein GCM10020092_050740 [Actinoplanes digitatis]